MRDSSLEIDGVSKHFGPVQALRDVTLGLEAGEVFGYLGPNGAGKTTTLRIVLGLVHPDAGRVRVMGRDARDPAARQTTGFLSGELRLWGGMTGRQVLEHFARFRPERPPVMRGEILEALDLDERTLRRRVKYLSHGTRQKLGLAAAMQHDPQLLLLDEPSLGLDPLVQQSFRELVRRFAERGAAVLFSSHILSEVDAVCSRVAIIRAGRIVAQESIESLRRQVVRRMSLRLAEPVPADLGELASVERMVVEGNTAELWVKGDLNPVVRRLARLEVRELVFPEPRLEDIFLELYAAPQTEPESWAR